ncbi:unnamed protein product [Closterium sp. NIES-54]
MSPLALLLLAINLLPFVAIVVAFALTLFWACCDGESSCDIYADQSRSGGTFVTCQADPEDPSRTSFKSFLRNNKNLAAFSAVAAARGSSTIGVPCNPVNVSPRALLTAPLCPSPGDEGVDGFGGWCGLSGRKDIPDLVPSPPAYRYSPPVYAPGAAWDSATKEMGEKNGNNGGILASGFTQGKR